MPKTSEGKPPNNVYVRCLEFLEEGSIPAITRVEDADQVGVFAVAHDFTGVPYLKASCYHHNPRRRALAALAMVRFARQIARENEYTPLP